VSPPIEGDEDIGNQENIPHLHISQECIENVILESPSKEKNENGALNLLLLNLQKDLEINIGMHTFKSNLQKDLEVIAKKFFKLKS
jgi:hypothetical protein